MKIYYILNGRLPTEKANGYQVSQMCQAFEENGAHVYLFRPQRVLPELHSPFKNKIREFYNLRKEIKIIDVWSFDFQNFAHQLHQFFDRFQSVTNLLHSFSFVLGLVFWFWRQNEDKNSIIYLRDVNLFSWLRPFLPQHLKKNVVLEVHSLPKPDNRKRRYARILNKAKAVLCVTGKMKADLIEAGLLADKIMVEHDAVDLESFASEKSQEECRKLLGYPIGKTIVAYVGNFHTNGQEKGIDDTIRASQYIFNKQSDVQFYFVGGPLDRVPRYEEIIQELHLPRENFHFFGRRPVADLPSIMGACDILVMALPWTNHFAYYASALKVFEYMASQRCIVATDLPAVMEVLSDNENSLLAKPSDPKSLAEKILMAIENPSLRSRLSQKAFEDVKYYSWNLRAKRIVAFIDSIGNIK